MRKEKMSNKIMTLRVWILAIAVVLSLFAINPSPGAHGVQIKTLEPGSIAAQQGVGVGQIIKSINGQDVSTVADFQTITKSLGREPVEFTVKTDKGEYIYNSTKGPGFSFDENLTVIDVEDFAPLQIEEKIEEINGYSPKDADDLKSKLDEIFPKQKIKIVTDKTEAAFLDYAFPHITVGEAAKSNIRKGLDLQGGTRVLLRPVSQNETITDKDIDDLIKVLSNRLNVYGLTDMRIRSANDWQGNKFILIELAGATRDEVKGLIAQQGKFEAKIGSELVFSGGKKDIPFVCRNDGSCSGIRNCGERGGQWYCRFEFAIHLSPEAAQRHAKITKNLDVVTSEDGREILSKKIDFYLDGKKVDSLQIGADLKGHETTAIAISGPGVGPTKMAAVEATTANMDKLQTILITGSLPFDLEIEKLDSISPTLGEAFVKNSFLVALLALLGVAAVLLVRYRSFKVLIPMVITVTSELIIILGFAALIQWNLDMAAIAGIIAAIGTGVDDQIVILDEVTKGESRYTNWKQKIKNAFFIIFAAYATTVAAMVPLWNAGAGLIRGFAVTTIVGVTIGVFITRPAFASIAEKLFK